MTYKTYNFTPEEIVSRRSRNAQFNFLIAFSYLYKHNMSVEDYMEFIGETAVTAWESKRGAPLMEIASNFAMHIACFGATDIQYIDDKNGFTILVKNWPTEEQLKSFGIPVETYDFQWISFKRIVEHIDIKCEWKREGEDFQIFLTRD